MTAQDIKNLEELHKSLTDPDCAVSWPKENAKMQSLARVIEELKQVARP